MLNIGGLFFSVRVDDHKKIAEEENKTAAAEPAQPKGKSTIGDGEWGIKYDDECLKFEQEW